eukprot:m.67979 g.67979  ORF g.67979 m.67979 type:complete len:412 (+) comp11927_c1_seq1:303-1538(+)
MEDYLSVAAEVVNMRLVSEVDELQSEDNFFGPEFTHQVFGQKDDGDEMKIFGYKNLCVKLFYAAASLHSYLSIEYDEVYSGDTEPDDIVKAIMEYMIPEESNRGALSCTTSESQFLDKLQSENSSFVPLGREVTRYSVAGKDFEIFMYDGETPGAIEYHNRMQFFTIWYIDGANYIDISDSKWKVLSLYQREETGGTTRYIFVGLLTLYEYYAWVQHIRPRISQCLVLPPFQRQGHASRLIQEAYNYILTKKDMVVDIAVEDPAEEFSRLRDAIDVSNCLKQISHVDMVCAPSRPFTDAIFAMMKEKLRLGKEQARKVFEILQWKFLDKTDRKAVKCYRLSIKRRLGQTHWRNKSDKKKQAKFLKPEEIEALGLDVDDDTGSICVSFLASFYIDTFAYRRFVQTSRINIRK